MDVLTFLVLFSALEGQILLWLLSITILGGARYDLNSLGMIWNVNCIVAMKIVFFSPR